MRAGGWTHKTKLSVALRNFANIPKNGIKLIRFTSYHVAQKLYYYTHKVGKRRIRSY
jgi:hypothetical protein